MEYWWGHPTTLEEILVKLSTVGLALAAALLITGCSGAPTTPAPTSASPSAAATPTATTLAPGAAVDKAALSTQLDEAQKSLTSLHLVMTTKATAAGQSFDVGMTGDLDVSDKANPRGALTLTGPMAMEMVLDSGEVYYIKMAMLGDQWFKATKEDLGTASIDPASQVNSYSTFLAKADKVVYVGEEQVEGAATKHYTLSVPKAALAGAAASATPAPSAAAETVPVELYVTEKGLVKKVSMAMTEPVMTMDIVMSKFNEPVTITIPTDAQPFPKR